MGMKKTYKYNTTKNRAEFATEHNISVRFINKYGLKFLRNNPEVLESIKLISQITGKGDKVSHEIKEARKEINKQKARETTKLWKEENKDKISEIGKEYREKNKDKIAAYQKEYKEKNREEILIKKREYAKRKYNECRGIKK